MKCIRASEKENCKRCVAAGIDCITYARRSGRPPGSGKKSKLTEMTAAPQEPGTSSAALLSSSTDVPPATTFASQSNTSPSSLFNPHTWTFLDQQQTSESSSLEPSTSWAPFSLASNIELSTADPLGMLPAMPSPVFNQLGADLDNALQHRPTSDNIQSKPSNEARTNVQQQGGSLTTSPLQLLAEVGTTGQSGSNTKIPFTRLNARSTPRLKLGSQLQHSQYFSSTSHVDDNEYNAELDPIELALISEKEAQRLCQTYFDNLQPMVGLLDSRTQDILYIRKSSTLLFAAVLSVASKFLEEFGSASQRLDTHLRRCLDIAIQGGSASLQTIQALIVICPWLDAGLHFSLDVTYTYLAIAYQRFARLLPRMEQLAQVQDHSVRSLQRAYLTLYNYDRGAALIGAQPKHFSVTELPLVHNIKAWASHPDAALPDWTLAALVALRHSLPHTLETLAGTQGGARRSPAVVKVIAGEFLADWEKTWITPSSNQTYLKIVGLHTMLSVMIVVLKDHAGQDTEAAILQQAVSAAIQALQTYVAAGQEASRYFVNHTYVMVAYAAGLLLKTIQQGKQTGSTAEVSVYQLIKQAADAMMEVGTRPSHRFGRSRIYGRRLLDIIGSQWSSRAVTRHASPVANSEGLQGGSECQTLDQPDSGFGGELGLAMDDCFSLVNMSAQEIDTLIGTDLWASFAADSLFDTGNFLSFEGVQGDL